MRIFWNFIRYIIFKKLTKIFYLLCKFINYIALFTFIIFIVVLINLDSIFNRFMIEDDIIKYDASEIYKFKKSLTVLTNFRNVVDCNAIFQRDPEAMLQAAVWTYEDIDTEPFYNKFIHTYNRCSTIKKYFDFIQKPLSDEEKYFPIAYVIDSIESINQMYFMVSAFYQPQNIYCITVDSRTKSNFQKIMSLLAECFSNIFVIQTPRSEKCSFQRVRSMFSCYKYLIQNEHKWKQILFIEGGDLPLKTNLEMVRIFKQLEDVFMIDIEPFNITRINKNNKNKSPPLQLWKSNVAATFSRETANIIYKHPKLWALYEYLKQIDCPEEGLWGTIAGNSKIINLPGGFDAPIFWKKIQEDCPLLYKSRAYRVILPTEDNPFPLYYYYIVRHQIDEVNHAWKYPNACKGTMIDKVCNLGVGDLPRIINRPELTVHMFNLKYQPAAFFCLYEAIKTRSLEKKEQLKFSALPYNKLPQVMMMRGVKEINELKFYF